MIRFLFLLLLAFGLWAQKPTATALPHSVVLTWADSSNPTGTTYNIYRAPGNCSGTPVFAQIAKAVAALTYTDSTVLHNTTYCYTTRALYNALESTNSNTAIAVVPLDVVPPVNLSVIVR